MSNTNMEQLVALMRAGELAVDLWRAEVALTLARDVYHARIKQYEHAFCGGQRVKFNQAAPERAALVQYTREHYAAAQAARKRVYSAKQKLRRAAGKVAMLSVLGAEREDSHA